jgi:hypothetical protein
LENKLNIERIWVQRSIAVVLLFMFWNGFTDVFWLASSLLFDPLQLFLWLILLWNYRSELKSMPFVWLLGAGVLLNNFFLSFQFSNLFARTIDLQVTAFDVSVLGKFISAILFTGTAWFLVFRNMLENHPKKRSYLITFLLLFLPSVLLVGADGLVFAGILMLVFILKSKERKPFHWFIIAQFVSLAFSVAQFAYQFFL